MEEDWRDKRAVDGRAEAVCGCGGAEHAEGERGDRWGEARGATEGGGAAGEAAGLQQIEGGVGVVKEVDGGHVVAHAGVEAPEALDELERFLDGESGAE